MPSESSDGTGDKIRDELEELLKEVEGAEAEAQAQSGGNTVAADASAPSETPEDIAASADALLAELNDEIDSEQASPAKQNEENETMSTQKNNVTPIREGENADASRSGTLSLDMTGEVNIDLKLNFGHQTVYFSCDNENLMIQLGDGTSFRIPFPVSGNQKRAA